MDLNSAMQQYFIVTGRQLEPLPPKPVLSDFYVPSEDHQNRELAFITLSMVGTGAFLWYSGSSRNDDCSAEGEINKKQDALSELTVRSRH